MYNVTFENAQFAWFEHKHYGDESGGGLWFDENKNLIDYDGVFSVPNDVVQKCEALGYNMEYAQE